MKVSNIWVFSDYSEHFKDIMGGAKEIGEKVVCFALNKDDAKKAFSFGADEVLLAKEGELVENLIPSFVENLNGQSGLVLMPNTKRCKAVAAALGAKLNAGVVTEVNALNLDNGVECERMMYGGLATSKQKINSALGIVLVNGGVFAPAEAKFDDSKEAKELSFIAPKNLIKCVNKLPKAASSVDLNKAKRIVAVGRGIAKQEDIALANGLCEAISAELGCSRPIAETEKWMEHERYIGISSVMPKPEIYISVGISGQVQHMVGVKDAGKIIAINKDKNAPIFDYADYGIVGDLYKVLPAVIAALK